MEPSDALLIAQAALIKAKSQEMHHHAHEIEKAINTLNHAIKIDCRASIEFALSVLMAAVDDFKNTGAE
jgi:hypothetical protein